MSRLFPAPVIYGMEEDEKFGGISNKDSMRGREAEYQYPDTEENEELTKQADEKNRGL
ncbi:MAG: hypothetical protein JWM56_100 [Candidatus Peribacteria bacterium]|nr:hypothetical protein [Candidatus Peribacteria bacterium]